MKSSGYVLLLAAVILQTAHAMRPNVLSVRQLSRLFNPISAYCSRNVQTVNFAGCARHRSVRDFAMTASPGGQGDIVGAQPRDKVGRPANWWQLPPVEGAQLNHHTDRYGSVVIEDAITNSSCTSPQEFASRLSDSMLIWRKAGIRAVWLRVATEASRLVPEAIELGFLPHHAASDHITLTAWLISDKPSRLPPGPSHFVGVAGLVLDSSTQRVLVVQEKSGPSAGIGLWKLPGGLVDNKEDIATAVQREVLEETGVPASFQRLMTIQENHQIRGPGREGSTDLFCVCFLTPVLTSDGKVPQPVAQEDEIAACQWMGVDELLSQPLYEDGIFNVMMQSALEAASSAGGLKCDRFPLTFRPGMSALMYPDLASQRPGAGTST